LTWCKTPTTGSGDEGPLNTNVAELFWHGDYLIAATHGRGMYRCRPLVNIFVDWSHTGYEDGTLYYPFDTVQEGIETAGHGTSLFIYSGDYDETGITVFNKRGRVGTIGGSATIR
jgi:hypothetical protein